MRSWNWQRVVRTSVAVVAMCVAAAACGGDNGGTDDGDEPAAEPAADEELPEEVETALAEAQELGLDFVTSREELETRAEEEVAEGGLDVIWSLGPEESVLASFYEAYPYIEGNVTLGELEGVEERERMLLEWEAGALEGQDVLYAATEVYPTAAGEMCSYDLLGMSRAGILDIPEEMIDPEYRTVVAAGSTAAVFGYNKETFDGPAGPPLPEHWDDLLENPDLYGPEGDFAMLGDVRIANFSAIVAEWGLDRAMEYYATFAEELEPTWVSRFGPFLIQMAQGEYDGFPFVNLHSTVEREPDYPNLGHAFVEPVPVRLSETHCVLNNDVSKSPHAALLMLEWMASVDGQAVLEETEENRLQSSIYGPYEDGLGDLLEGYELSVSAWEHFPQQADYIEQIIGAAGFPQPIPEE